MMLARRIAKPDESYEGAAIRELKEKSGPDIGLTAFLGVFHNHNMVWSNNDKAHTIGTYFPSESFTGELRTDEESLILSFFNKDEFPELFAEDHRPAVKACIDGVLYPLPKENKKR